MASFSPESWLRLSILLQLVAVLQRPFVSDVLAVQCRPTVVQCDSENILTYTWQLHATVTAFRCSALLLDVQVSELATGGLDDTDFVRPRVIPGRFGQLCPCRPYALPIRR